MTLTRSKWMPAALAVGLLPAMIISCWLLWPETQSAQVAGGGKTAAPVAAKHESPAVFTAPQDEDVATVTTTTTTEVVESVDAADPTAEAVMESDVELPALTEVGPLDAPLPDTDWDPREFEMLQAVPQTPVFTDLAPGATLPPAKPLAMEELLAANRPDSQIGYAQSGPQVGRPFDVSGNSGRPGGTQPGQITIESPNWLDYDEEHHAIYGQGRVTVRYGNHKLEADRVMIDTRLREIQAHGNVVLMTGTDYIEAESMQFDTVNSQGVLYNARGRTDIYYFLADPECNDGRTNIRQLSERETFFKESSFTGCNFPVPHYRLHAQEFTIFSGDRIFAKNVVLYIWEKPVLWLPWLTRSLSESNPWGFSAGSDGELGFFVQVWYDFYQHCYTPSDVDEKIMVGNMYSHTRVRLDSFSERGSGKFLHHSYYLDHGKHQGKLDLYQLTDDERDIAGETGGDNRYYADWVHRTRINDELQWLINIDYISDPDLYFDVLDRIRGSTERQQGRFSERLMQTGLEWTTEDFFAGLQVEVKDRIGRDRLTNFSDPKDDDNDFARAYNTEEFFTLDGPGIGPDGRFYESAGRYTNSGSLDTSLDEGISADRWGRVTERLPQLSVTSNRMRLWCLPLWYHVDLDVFNNLDKGLNVVGTDDDSFVHGFDLYQSISHLAKFCDRYTLLTKVGLGFGVAERADDSYNLDFPEGSTFPYVYDGQVSGDDVLGLTFIDEDTFLVGEKEMSLSDVPPAFVYGDIDSRFNARITDSLSAFIRYRFREGTDNIGTFYETIGSRKTMDDLYAFRNPEHWIEGGVMQNFFDPHVTLNASAGRNLQGESDITSHELRGYTNVSASYVNDFRTIFLNSGISLQDRQLRDPTDPNEYVQSSLVYYLSGSYLPVHKRYWSRATLYAVQNVDNDPLDLDISNSTLDDELVTAMDLRVGAKIGRKYAVEYRTKVRSQDESVSDSRFQIERDFHDMIAGVSFEVKGDKLSDETETTEQDNVQLRLNVRFKTSAEKGVTPKESRTSKLYSGRKVTAFERAAY